KGALLLQHMHPQGSTSPTPPDAALVAEITRAETTEAVPLHAAAERCLLQAIYVARQQQAKCLELRAIVSLARLWQAQGKRAEACQMMAESYGWFTEGFDTPDLREAPALPRDLQWLVLASVKWLAVLALDPSYRESRVRCRTRLSRPTATEFRRIYAFHRCWNTTPGIAPRRRQCLLPGVPRSPMAAYISTCKTPRRH